MAKSRTAVGTFGIARRDNSTLGWVLRGAAAGERESLAIVNAILALARGLGMATTAEGVETVEQADAMRALGCDQLQGYLFGRPVAAGAPDEPRDDRLRATA